MWWTICIINSYFTPFYFYIIPRIRRVAQLVLIKGLLNDWSHYIFSTCKRNRFLNQNIKCCQSGISLKYLHESSAFWKLVLCPKKCRALNVGTIWLAGKAGKLSVLTINLLRGSIPGFLSGVTFLASLVFWIWPQGSGGLKSGFSFS